MEAYETSSKALRDLLSHPSLQRDNVERTMNRLSDALADHADIERAMIEESEPSQGAAGLSTVDEEALDAELATLAAEEKQKTHVDERRHAAEHNLEATPIMWGSEQRDSIAREPVPAS
jgi:charged multivesicular body protein 7